MVYFVSPKLHSPPLCSASRTTSLEIWTARQIIIIHAQPIRNAVQHFSREVVPVPAEPPPYEKKTALSGGKTKKKLPNFFLRLCDTHKKYILQKKFGQNGHSSPQQWSDQSTDAYMGLPPPTRWSIFHLVGRLTTPNMDSTQRSVWGTESKDCVKRTPLKIIRSHPPKTNILSSSFF